MLPALLALLAAWCGASLAMELLAWGGHRLGRRRPAPALRVPPRAGEAGVARMAFLGDLQRGVADVARPLVAALEAEPVDVLVSSGDLVAHGEAPYYGVLLDAFEAAGLVTPLRVVPGNHDLQPRGVRDATGGRALFEAAFGARDWILPLGPVLLVGLDDALGPVSEGTLAWLDTQLAAWTGPWILVCHRPLRRLGREDAPVEPDLIEVVQRVQARPPLLVVMGHDHAWIDREVDGVRYVVNAHGGDVHGSGLHRDPFELLRVTVREDGTWTMRRERHRRRPWPRVYLRQLAVRAWWARRRGLGRVLSFPAGPALALLGLRAPLGQGA